MRKSLMFGIAAAALAIGILFTSCPTDDGDSYSGPPSVKYAGKDSSDTTYVLEITGGTSNNPEPGDTYVLTITGSAGSKTSRGTVISFSGNDLGLEPTGGTLFTVTVSATGIYGFSGNIAVEGDDTPVSPSGGITPTKPGNPAEPDPTAPPVVKDVQVYKFNRSDGSSASYTGSGTVKSGDDDFGRINNGKLSLVFPYPVPVTVWTLESFTERSGEIKMKNVTLSGSAKGFSLDNFEFIEGGSSEDPDEFGFVKDLTRSGNNDRTGTYIFYWYVDKELTINGVLEVEIIVDDVSPSWRETRNSHEEWSNLALQPGWNRVQCDYSRADTSTWTDGFHDIDIKTTEIYTNAPANTSSFKWTIDPKFHP